MAQTEHAPHAVVLTSPGVGHVATVAQLAARLAAHHGFTVTIITYGNLSSPRHLASVLTSFPPGISTTVLQEVPLDDLPADAHVLTRILTVVRRTLPHLRALLRSLLDSPAGVTVFLADMLCPAALAVAQELGVPRYVFFTSSLMLLVSLLHTPELTKTITCEIRDLSEPVVFPGCVPLHGTDHVDTLQDSAKPVYALTLELCLDFLHADGYIVNTFDALEHDTLEAFKELSGKGVYPPAYVVGPFIRSFSDEAAKHRCLRWLDEQPDGSVLYVCFGSGGTLSTVQTAELAAGLEASGQRFLWVVRFPNDKDSSGGYLGTTTGRGEDPLSYLPEGFTGRTRDAGLVVPEWAPQVEVLGHRAVGGFLSHCGWNSALEAAAAGVPVLAWPLFAEQRMNAVKLAWEHAGLAIRVREREDDGVVPREEVAALARELMVGPRGAAARNKARELRVEALKASAPGGPEQQELAAVVGRWNCGNLRRAAPPPVEASTSTED